MKMLLKIAYSNILRHKGRTFRSALTIGVALMFFIYMDSLISGMDNGAINNIIQLSTSGITLHTKEYMKDKESYPLKYGITNYEQIRSFVLENKTVDGCTPRTQFLGQLSNYSDVIPVLGTVVNSLTDTTVFTLHKHIEGLWFSNESSREIIIGKKLADELGVKLGESITLYSLTKYDSRNADEFKLIGVLNTTDPNINKNLALLTFDAANDFLDLEGLVSQVNISVKGTNYGIKDLLKRVDQIKSSILNTYEDIHCETFYDASAAFLQVNKQKRSFGIIFMSVLLLIAAIGIFNTVLMSVYERIREIGVLRAHGMSPGEITWLFLMEGFITGVAGGLLGVILGITVNLYLVTIGFPVDKIAGNVDTAGIPIWGTMYGQWNIGSFIFSFLFAIIVATLAGLIPSRKAAKMEVTKALRFV